MENITQATASDVLRIVDMIELLRESVEGPLKVDRAWTARTVANLIESPEGFVAVSPGGFIAGSIQPTIINSAPIATELGWYATDGTGLLLLRAFEDWARKRGAILVQLSTGPNGMDLTRLGYRKAEQAWVK